MEEELSDCEDEQTTVEATPWVKPTRKEPSPVLVLNEMEEAERVGRFCRTLKYKLKSVCRSNEMDLNAEKVSTLSADVTKDAIETAHKKHVCILCGMEYARKPNLVSHMRIHTGETPYKCEICGKCFRRSDWLLQHTNMHQNKRRASRDPRRRRCYSCEFCEKKYYCGKAFERHVRTHTGERPYPCAICEKRFYDEGCLKTHLMCHSDDRPFTCSDCGHSFKRLGTLTKHRRIHTGEKAYSCKTCGKRFRYKYSVTLHLKTRCSRRS